MACGLVSAYPLIYMLVCYVFSEAERRQNPTAVMDALQLFDKKVREPQGMKYMGARSVEDLSTEQGSTKLETTGKGGTSADANDVPALPAKTKESEDKSPSDKQKLVSTEDGMYTPLHDKMAKL